jgi:histidyl-tRNA synthetase
MGSEETYRYISNHVFRNEVPEELRLRFFRCLGLKGFDDYSWWPESLLEVESIEESLLECIVELEPYYQRCYSYYALRRMTKNAILQVLRHIAKLSGMKLEVSDRSRTAYGQKRIRMFRFSVLKKSEENSSVFEVSFV